MNKEEKPIKEEFKDQEKKEKNVSLHDQIKKRIALINSTLKSTENEIRDIKEKQEQLAQILEQRNMLYVSYTARKEELESLL